MVEGCADVEGTGFPISTETLKQSLLILLEEQQQRAETVDSDGHCGDDFTGV